MRLFAFKKEDSIDYRAFCCDNLLVFQGTTIYSNELTSITINSGDFNVIEVNMLFYNLSYFKMLKTFELVPVIEGLDFCHITGVNKIKIWNHRDKSITIYPNSNLYYLRLFPTEQGTNVLFIETDIEEFRNHYEEDILKFKSIDKSIKNFLAQLPYDFKIHNIIQDSVTLSVFEEEYFNIQKPD